MIYHQTTRSTFFLVIAVFYVAPAAQGATVLWDESVDGDASDVAVTAEALTLVNGENLIQGSQVFLFDQDEPDFDFFSLAIPSNFQITSITASVSNPLPNGSFTWILIDASTTITVMTTLFQTNGSVTPLMVPNYPLTNSQYLLQGLSAAKAFGSSPSIDYSWSVSVAPIPIPAAAWLFCSALGLLAWIKRRTI